MLTPEALGIAVRANAHYRRAFADWLDLLDALGVLDDSDAVAYGEAVAEAVAAWQTAHPPLAQDGVLGPKTAAALRRETWTAPAGADCFIADGKPIIVGGVKVVDFREPGGLSFYATPKPLYSTRSKPPNLSVLHWSVTATAHGAFSVLLGRGFSVQLLLDDDGTFYQCGDLVTMGAWHAGVVNARSFGVEIAGGLPPRAGDPGVPLDVRGDMTRYGYFSTRQVEAITRAWPALHRALGIPLVLPRANPIGPAVPALDGVSRFTDYRVAKGEFAGACGHYHCTAKKGDAGTQLWAPLRAAGFEVA